jgi:hypothetical protein
MLTGARVFPPVYGYYAPTPSRFLLFEKPTIQKPPDDTLPSGESLSALYLRGEFT